MKSPILFALCGAMALGACTDPASLGGNPNDPNQKTKQGAAVGAAAGAILGVLVSNKDDRAKGAITGGLVGAGVGAGVGYSLDKQEADLRRDLGNDNVTIQNTGDRLIVTLPQDITFASDSATLSGGIQGDLNAVANNLQSYPNSTVQVIGHTDSTGEAAYNQNLSVQRSNSVVNVLSGAGVQKFMEKIANEQEILMAAADLAIQIFALESTVLRTEKIIGASSERKQELLNAAVKVFAFEAAETAATAARKGAFYIEEGDTLTMILSGVRRFTKYDASGLLAAKRALAAAACEEEKYLF